MDVILHHGSVHNEQCLPPASLEFADVTINFVTSSHFIVVGVYSRQGWAHYCLIPRCNAGDPVANMYQVSAVLPTVSCSLRIVFSLPFPRTRRVEIRGS